MKLLRTPLTVIMAILLLSATNAFCEEDYAIFFNHDGEYEKIPYTQFKNTEGSDAELVGKFEGRGPDADATTHRVFLIKLSKSKVSGSCKDDRGAAVSFSKGHILDLMDDGRHFSASVIGGWFATLSREGTTIPGIVVNNTFYPKVK